MSARLGRLRLCAGLLLFALASGCAGGQAQLRAPRVGYPVSLTPALFDGRGVPRLAREEEIVGHFELEFSQWTVLWGAWSLSSEERDLSECLREQIESRAGNAIVNLTVEGQVPASWYFTSLLLIVPTASTITVEGDVVRLGPDPDPLSSNVSPHE